MLRDMRDVDGICPSCIIGEISLGLLMEYDSNIHDHAKLNQYEILDLFVTTSRVYSRIKKSKYWNIQGRHNLCCVPYRNKDKGVIIHMIVITERFRHMT
jgi:hypothetical protein